MGAMRSEVRSFLWTILCPRQTCGGNGSRLNCRSTPATQWALTYSEVLLEVWQLFQSLYEASLLLKVNTESLVDRVELVSKLHRESTS